MFRDSLQDAAFLSIAGLLLTGLGAICFQVVRGLCVILERRNPLLHSKLAEGLLERIASLLKMTLPPVMAANMEERVAELMRGCKKTRSAWSLARIYCIVTDCWIGTLVERIRRMDCVACCLDLLLVSFLIVFSFEIEDLWPSPYLSVWVVDIVIVSCFLKNRVWGLTLAFISAVALAYHQNLAFYVWIPTTIIPLFLIRDLLDRIRRLLCSRFLKCLLTALGLFAISTCTSFFGIEISERVDANLLGDDPVDKLLAWRYGDFWSSLFAVTWASLLKQPVLLSSALKQLDIDQPGDEPDLSRCSTDED